MRSKKTPWATRDHAQLVRQCTVKLSRRPYDVVTLTTLEKAFRTLGQLDEATEIKERIRIIKDVTKKHPGEYINLEQARDFFISLIEKQDYAAAADILIKLGRNLKLQANYIDGLLRDARNISLSSMDGLLEVLSDQETSMDIGVLCSLGYVYKHSGRRHDAIRVLDAGSSLFEKHLPIRFAMYTMTAREDPSSMRKAWILHKLQPGDPTGAQTLAAADLRFGQTASAIRTLFPFYLEDKANKKTIRLLGLAYIRNNDFDAAREILAGTSDGDLREVGLAQAFMSRDDHEASAIAVKIIEKKFDPFAVGVFVISNGLAGRWLYNRMGSDLMPEITEEQFSDVRHKIQALQDDRGVYLESLIMQEWQDSIALRGAKISSIYGETTMRPRTRGAAQDVYHPSRMGPP